MGATHPFGSMSVDTIDTRIDICQYVRVTSPTTVGRGAPTSDDTALDGLCCGSLRGPALTEADATELADVLKALADPVRLRILSLVGAATDGELCACDLPHLLERSQPTVSHHLSILVGAGLLTREQRGKWAWFRLRPARLEAVGAILRTCC